MADGEATQAPTLKRTTPMRITREQKKAIRARRQMIRGIQSGLMTRKEGEEYKQKQKKKKISQKKTGLGRWFGIYEEEEDEYIPVVSCRTDAECTSRNCQNGTCVKYKPFQKNPRRKSTRETYAGAQQSEERIKKYSEEINNKEITRIVKLSRKTRTQKESQELNRLLSRHPEIKRKRVGRQAITPGSFPNLKF